jgi:hypothetical protein
MISGHWNEKDDSSIGMMVVKSVFIILPVFCIFVFNVLFFYLIIQRGGEFLFSFIIL